MKLCFGAESSATTYFRKHFASFLGSRMERYPTSWSAAFVDILLIMSSAKIPEGLQSFLRHAESLHPSNNARRENGFAREFQVYISLFSLDQGKPNSMITLFFISKLNFYFSRRIKWLLKLGETEIFDYSLISVLFQYSVHNYLEIKLICFKVSPRFTIYSTTGMLSIKMTKVYL